MNRIKLLLIGTMFVGVLLLGIGAYLAFDKKSQNTAAQNPTPTPIIIYQPAPTQSTVNSQITKISKTITVPSDVMWYDTGVEVTSGASVKIEHKGGHWTNMVGTNKVDGVGKDFERRHLLIVPKSYLASLVGKVGGSSFHVGNLYKGKPGTGRLYLSLNDLPKTYDDNDGELDVLIEVK